MVKVFVEKRGRRPPKERKPEEVKEVKRVSGLQRKRYISSIRIGSASLASIMEETRAHGFTLHPKTSQMVKRHLMRALEEGTISGEREVVLSAAALVAAGMETAGQAGRRSVRPADVVQGWGDIISLINCPPHRCFHRSVIQRTDELKNSSPVFKKLVRGINE